MTPSSNIVPLSLATRSETPAETTRVDRAWTIGQIESSARARGTTPESRLLAVFDVIDDLFNRADREARKFVVVLAGLSQGRALDRAGAEVLGNFRALIDTFASEASLRDPEGFALSWRILMNGAIIKAVEGDLDSALRAKEMARDLISRHQAITQQPIGHDAAHGSVSRESFDLDTEWISSLGAQAEQRANSSVQSQVHAQASASSYVQPITGGPAHSDALRYTEMLSDLEWDLA